MSGQITQDHERVVFAVFVLGTVLNKDTTAEACIEGCLRERSLHLTSGVKISVIAKTARVECHPLRGAWSGRTNSQSHWEELVRGNRWRLHRSSTIGAGKLAAVAAGRGPVIHSLVLSECGCRIDWDRLISIDGRQPMFGC